MFSATAELLCYTRLLTGDSNGLLTFQVVNRKSRTYARTLYGSPGRWWHTLSAYNTVGCDIYVMPNHSGSDKRRAEDIVTLRAVFADYDAGVPDEWALEPSFVVESSVGKAQAYWLLEPKFAASDMAQWGRVVRSIVAATGADPAAVDAPRVLRCPGFANTKYDGRPVARIISESSARYTLDQLEAAWPEVAPARPKVLSTSSGSASEQRRYQAYLKTAVDGAPANGWNQWAYRLAATGVGSFGLGWRTVFELLYDAINARHGHDAYPYCELELICINAAHYSQRVALPAGPVVTHFELED